MDRFNEEMVKTLTSLIDDTLEEIEEIKKSKFAASEISLGDSASNLAGKSKNGELEAKKSEDEDEDDEEEKEEDKDMDKAESCAKKEDKDEDEEEDKKKKSDMSKKEDKKEDEDKEDKKEDWKEMKKSLAETETLLKSYFDQKISTFEDRLSKMAATIEAIANAPVPRKSVPANVAPLYKSASEVEPLSKSEVASKLFELKKTGKAIDSSDIARVETGNQATVQEIANKYGLR